MAQQTAVEWLLSKLKEHTNPVASDINSYSIRIPKSDMVNAIEQVKRMEKEQIMKAYDDGAIETMQEQEGLDISKDQNGEESEQYYNQKYSK